ncbi:MAG TPA: NUDIX hydrolase [Micromonosporaceae bacterium]|nr:NUDIX hydrolase [Micromonosporaceae bacterium]
MSEPEYRVRQRVERFTNRIFSLVTDEVEMPDGDVANRDYLVHVGAVGVVALDESERVILIRQYRHAVGAPLWELPAGLIDQPGEDLVDAAARELAEEADLTAEQWDLLGDVHTSPGCSNEVIRLFLARRLGAVPRDRRHTRTHEEAGLTTRWMDLDDAVGMALSGEITNASCLVGVLATAQARSRGWSTLRTAGTPLQRSAPPSPGQQPSPVEADQPEG